MVGERLPNLDNLTDREILIMTIQTVNEMSKLVAEHNRRIGVLELWRSAVAGALALLVALVSVLGAFGKLVWK